jgi:hypothetical protein
MPKAGESRLVPKTLPDFQQHFPNKEACIAHLYNKRFPIGFVCSYCEQHEGDAGPPYTFARRPTVYRCRNCRNDHASEQAAALLLVLGSLSRNEPNSGNECRSVQEKARD